MCRYDVYWTESNIEWASRWDAYLSMPNGSVHWFSILNSLLVVLVMSVIVAVILMRTVRRDLAKYEELLVEGQVCATTLLFPDLQVVSRTNDRNNSAYLCWYRTSNKYAHEPLSRSRNTIYNSI